MHACMLTCYVCQLTHVHAYIRTCVRVHTYVRTYVYIYVSSWTAGLSSCYPVGASDFDIRSLAVWHSVRDVKLGGSVRLKIHLSCIIYAKHQVNIL